jgi:hypothetical protein
MSLAGALLLGVFLVAYAVIVAVSRRSMAPAIAERHPEFDDALRRMAEKGHYPKDVFDPATARLLLQDDALTDRYGRPVQTHRIYKTPTEQYFLFICTSGQDGYLAPISERQARNALRASPELYRREFQRNDSSTEA